MFLKGIGTMRFRIKTIIRGAFVPALLISGIWLFARLSGENRHSDDGIQSNASALAPYVSLDPSFFIAGNRGWMELLDRTTA